ADPIRRSLLGSDQQDAEVRRLNDADEPRLGEHDRDLEGCRRAHRGAQGSSRPGHRAVRLRRSLDAAHGARPAGRAPALVPPALRRPGQHGRRAVSEGAADAVRARRLDDPCEQHGDPHLPAHVMTTLGVVFTADRRRGELPAYAVAAESAGLDELWLWEDCFLGGGIATSATALAATERIVVGLGVMPAVFRNPVACAMEIGTLARIHPGRFLAGLGHGVPAWIEQIGALPEKPGRALEERVSAVRRLLAGERVSTSGDYVNLEDAQLGQAPAVVPPVVLGVRRPFGLRASGRSADGTILAEPAPPSYINWARAHIEEGRTAAGRRDLHRVIVFVKGRIDPDRRHAREWVAEILLEESVAAQLTPLDREDELAELRSTGDPPAIAARMPEDLLDQLTATGSPDQVLATLTEIAAAGVDSIAMAPIGPDPDEQLQLLAQTVAPAFRASTGAC